MRPKRVRNIPRQDPADVQADAAATRLSKRHLLNPLRIFDWARGCGVDLSDLCVEEQVFRMETETLDSLIESGQCSND